MQGVDISMDDPDRDTIAPPTVLRGKQLHRFPSSVSSLLIHCSAAVSLLLQTHSETASNNNCESLSCLYRHLFWLMDTVGVGFSVILLHFKAKKGRKWVKLKTQNRWKPCGWGVLTCWLYTCKISVLSLAALIIYHSPFSVISLLFFFFKKIPNSIKNNYKKCLEIKRNRKWFMHLLIPSKF